MPHSFSESHVTVCSTSRSFLVTSVRIIKKIRLATSAPALLTFMLHTYIATYSDGAGRLCET